MSVIVENFKNGEENYLCAVNMGCIVLADLYLLYFVKMADEKNYYEKQLIALEQQAKVQYEYYLTQAKKYDQTIQILHDVNKHIKAIEGLYGAEQENGRRICNKDQRVVEAAYSGSIHRKSDLEYTSYR